MRPRYVIVVLAIVAAAAVVALGPLRGRSVEDGFGDIAGKLQATLSGASAPRKSRKSASRASRSKRPDARLRFSRIGTYCRSRRRRGALR